MKIELGESYVVDVRLTIPGNGLMIYDFPGFDTRSFELIQVIDSVIEKTNRAYVIEESDGNIIIKMKRLGEDGETIVLPKNDKSVGFRGYKLQSTWGDAFESGSIRILRVLGRNIPFNIGGVQRV